MPYKSEKIKIEGTKHDRRIKLTEDDKELIRWLREEEKLSQRKLAQQFGVSRRLITFILDPEKHKKNIEARKKRGGSKIYYDRENQSEAIKNTRRYKQELFLKGEIKLKK